MPRLTVRSLVFVLFETTVIVAGVWAAAYVRLGDYTRSCSTTTVC